MDLIERAAGRPLKRGGMPWFVLNIMGPVQSADTRGRRDALPLEPPAWDRSSRI
jgi:hypothetical protein